MSAANVNNILRNPGRLSAGGTILGITRDAEMRFIPRYYTVTAEEYGQQPVEVIDAGKQAILAGVMRTYDSDMVGKLKFNTYSVTGSARPGTLLSANSFALTFTPLDSANKTINIKKAIPLLDEAAAMQLSLEEEIGIAFAFLCIPDSSLDVYTIT